MPHVRAGAARGVFGAGTSGRRSSQCTWCVTTARPASSMRSRSPRRLSTTGFGPGGSRGMSMRMVRKPSSSESSRVSAATPGGATGGAGAGAGRQAVTRAVSTPASSRRVISPRTLLAARRGASRGCAAMLIVLGASCARPPLLQQAIAARGGPLPALVRESEAEVSLGFPGVWRWRTAVATRARYAWTVYTTGAPLHHLYDGGTVRAYVGSALAAEDASPDAPFRTHARFMAVVHLDDLAMPGVRLRELPATARPPGAHAALEAVFADTGARYVIGLDPRRLVVSVEGPVDLAPFGRRRVRAVLRDHRAVGRLTLARASWTAGGAALADERTLHACPLRTP